MTQPELPGLLTRAANFVGAVVEHVATGMRKADPATYEARLAACHGCPRRRDDWVCAECGCYLTSKAGWAEQDCPLGKWPLPLVGQNAAPPGPATAEAGCTPCEKARRDREAAEQKAREEAAAAEAKKGAAEAAVGVATDVAAALIGP